jgi:hypothetical protein
VLHAIGRRLLAVAISASALGWFDRLFATAFPHDVGRKLTLMTILRRSDRRRFRRGWRVRTMAPHVG